MSVIRIDSVVLSVRDLAEATAFWSDLLGLEFRPPQASGGPPPQHVYTAHAAADDRAHPRTVQSVIGLELMERGPEPRLEGIRCVVFEVDNMDAAKVRMAAAGIRCTHMMHMRGFEEAVYMADDLRGVRVVLRRYEAGATSRPRGVAGGNIEKIDRVSLNVKSCDEAIRFWSGILGLVFPPGSHDPQRIRERGKVTHGFTEWADDDEKARPIAAISTTGIELMERDPPLGREGFRGLVLKVRDIEEAKARLASRGVRLLHTIDVGDVVKQAIYHPDDLHGTRLTLCQRAWQQPYF